jgi:tetratricopeptide (TPR) repeat protein
MKRRHHWLVGGSLFFITLSLYWPATTFEFVNFDDQLYTYENSDVMKGLSWHGIKQAFILMEPANWHPVTIISHMADVSMYGMNAGGHHLTSIIFHAANAVLLWLLVVRLTGWFWPGVLVAALFAWHPFNVESVAWIAERKNVLSTFFFILTLLAYQRHAKEERPGKFYVLALACCALGLAAKAMLITLPFLLLVLDWWPLERTPAAGFKIPVWKKLVLEKTPFFALCFADAAVSYLAQAHSGAVRSLEAVPLETRLANIPIAYLSYLEKTFWPANLSIFYPLPETIRVGPTMGAFAVLAMLSVMAWRFHKDAPWFLAGWLWFLGTLVPVIGLLQVGDQAMADRYAYLPLIGIFLILAGTLNACTRLHPRVLKFAIVVVAVVLSGCLTATARQLACWHDSISLFTQAVSVDDKNAKAQSLLGRAYSGAGQTGPAIKHFIIAVRLYPDATEWWFDLGREYITAGKYAEAAQSMATAIQKFPDNVVLHNLRGVALMLAGNQGEARAEFESAIKRCPDYANPYFNLGKSLAIEGRHSEAIVSFSDALKLNPDWPEALENLAKSHAALGDFKTAATESGQALQLATVASNTALAKTLSLELKAYQVAAAPK